MGGNPQNLSAPKPGPLSMEAVEAVEAVEPISRRPRQPRGLPPPEELRLSVLERLMWEGDDDGLGELEEPVRVRMARSDPARSPR